MRHNPGDHLDRVRPTLLLTRPEPQSLEFAAAFRMRFGADWPIVISPLTDIRFLDAGPVPADADSVIFTSQNAVEGFARLSPDFDIVAWCVGERTAATAKQTGFDTRIGPGDATSLARMIIAESAGQRMIYARGRTIAVDMAALLDSCGFEVLPLIVYDQVRRPPTSLALSAIGGSRPILLPLFSPQSARIAAEAFPDATAPILVAAMSPAVAEAAADLSAKRTVVAARPDGEAMQDALADLIATADIP